MKVIKVLMFILFLTFSAHALAETECKYYSEADVVNDVLVNKKEHYTCEEKSNFIVQFLTEEKYQNAVIMLFATILENI